MASFQTRLQNRLNTPIVNEAEDCGKSTRTLKYVSLSVIIFSLILLIMIIFMIYYCKTKSEIENPTQDVLNGIQKNKNIMTFSIIFTSLIIGVITIYEYFILRKTNKACIANK